VLTTQGYAQREDAKAGFYADWEVAFSAGFAWTFNNPLWAGKYPWNFQWGAGAIHRDYDDPDPTINPLTPETDRVFWTARGFGAAGRGDLVLGTPGRVPRPGIEL